MSHPKFRNPKQRFRKFCILGLAFVVSTVLLANALNHSANAAGTSTIVFSENFEATFPGSWRVFDGNPDSGSDYWGVTSYRSYGGSKSAWCAQVGDHSVRGIPNKDAHQYDNNMVAFLSIGDFDATKWDMAWVSFYAWVDTEVSRDWIQLGSTGTGEPPVSVLWTKSGTYNSWSKYDVRIPEDSLKSRLRLDFVFASDTSSFKEGVYLDDIVLTKYDITLDNYEITPQKASPGQTVNFKYYISNPSPYTVNIGLGASIRDPYGNTINDPNNDKVVSLPPGFSWQTRPFVIPSSAPKGIYDVMFGIYADLIPGSGFVRQWDLKTANDLLTITQYKLTVKASPSPYGSPNPSYGEHWYNVGAQITATVDSPTDESAGTRYRCTGWSGTGSVPTSGTGTSVTFTINEDSSITWNWVTQYKLAVNSDHGSPNPSVGEHWYDKGTQVTASVNSPADEIEGTRYKNVGWTGSGSVPASGTSNSVTFYMNSPSSITWNWKPQYKLSVNSAYGSPSGSSWYDESTYAYASLGSTIVSGPEGTRFVFINWSGDASGTSATSDRIYIDRPKTAIANWKTQYYLKISTDPSNLKQPTASPSGPWYDEDTIVTLTAQTVSGYEFEGWTLDGSQLTGNPIFVTMNSPHTAVAKYSLKTILNLSSITCRVSSPSIQTGSSIKVNGSITPVHSRVTVTLTYTKPDDSTFNRTTLTDSLGTYSDSYVPDFAGLWSVQASWAGDSDHAPAESEVVSFAVGTSLQSLRVSISHNGTELYNGDIVSFTITISDENGNPIDPDSLSATYDSTSVQPTRTSLGNYTYAQRLLSGLHTLSVVASKSGYIQGINTETILVKKAKVSLDLLVSQERVVTGEKIEIKGRLKPSIENVAVLLAFYGPNNRTETEEATTDSKGSFKLVFLPKDSGLWRVKARFSGDVEHEGAESEASFLVEEEKPNQQVEQPSGLGMSEVLNIVLAVVVITFLIILVKGGKKKMPKLLSTALTPIAQTDYLTRLRTEIAKLTAELALLGFALAALSWTICWIIIILPYTPRRYKEWAFEHRVSILEATFWFGTFNAIVSIILWVVSLGG